LYRIRRIIKTMSGFIAEKEEKEEYYDGGGCNKIQTQGI
jgi:hypothetical protein